MFQISIWGLGTLFGGGKPTKAPPMATGLVCGLASLVLDIDRWAQGNGSCAVLLLSRHQCSIHDETSRVDPQRKRTEVGAADHSWHTRKEYRANIMELMVCVCSFAIYAQSPDLALTSTNPSLFSPMWRQRKFDAEIIPFSSRVALHRTWNFGKVKNKQLFSWNLVAKEVVRTYYLQVKKRFALVLDVKYFFDTVDNCVYRNVLYLARSSLLCDTCHKINGNNK